MASRIATIVLFVALLLGQFGSVRVYEDPIPPPCPQVGPCPGTGGGGGGGGW